jgi:hypothetical protein
VDRAKIVSWLKTFGHGVGLNKEEAEMFIAMCNELQLNPFKREVHVNVYNSREGRQLSIVVGYEVYLRRAERSGLLEWWRKGFGKDGNDLTAWVEIKRRDREEPFRHDVWMSEVRPAGGKDFMWKKMPRFMMMKTCISQAFRFAFPVEVGELPYTYDEMPGYMVGRVGDDDYEEPTQYVEEPAQIEAHEEPQQPEQAQALPEQENAPEGQEPASQGNSEEVSDDAEFKDVVEFVNRNQKVLKVKAPEIMLRAKKVKDGESEESYADIIREAQGGQDELF